jgi:hypothetical protein
MLAATALTQQPAALAVGLGFGDGPEGEAREKSGKLYRSCPIGSISAYTPLRFLVVESRPNLPLP